MDMHTVHIRGKFVVMFDNGAHPKNGGYLAHVEVEDSSAVRIGKGLTPAAAIIDALSPPAKQ